MQTSLGHICALVDDVKPEAGPCKVLVRSEPQQQILDDRPSSPSHVYTEMSSKTQIMLHYYNFRT